MEEKRLPEYLQYWGLNRTPFSLTPDPEMLYLSNQHRECLLRLRYAIESNKGGALLISEHAGDGKTSVLARLRKDLEKDYPAKNRVVFIDHPTLTVPQMIQEIGRQLDLKNLSRDKMQNLNRLKQHLLEFHQQGFICVLIIDEGQMISDRPDLLQELRILLNFCVADSFLLTFILYEPSSR